MRLTAVALLAGLFSIAVLAEESPEEQPECSKANIEACDRNTLRKWLKWVSLAGPDQVERRLLIDSLPGDPLIKLEQLDDWRDKRQQLEEDSGISWSTDYIGAYMHASESLGDSTGAGGSLRFSGVWNVTGDQQANSGALIWKLEHRHAYGSNVSPQDLASEVGYAGLLHLTLSDQGGRLTNLYWRQRMKDGDLVMLGGWLDTGDYVDVYTLGSPWTGFFNYVFSTGGASIAVPNEGLGIALGGYLNDNLYVIGGFADANSDPHDPFESIDNFFAEQETFKHLDIGWNSSRDTAFLNNIHLTLWQVDERKEVGVADGWGTNLSWSRLYNEHWTTFIRGGYAEDGGAILEQTVSTGFAWSKVPGGNQLGVGLNWGIPMESTYGPDLPEQSTLEVFYRIQFFRELAITPDIQYIRNPALNPDEDSVWVLGLRARLVF